MKAILQKRYGGAETLYMGEAEKPVPQKGEVLVKVKGTSANAGDWHLMRGNPWVMRFFTGLFSPRLALGNDVAGVVVELGPGVTDFEVSDEVLGDVSGTNFGGYAEYVRVKQEHLVKKPKQVSWEQASIVGCAGGAAYKGLHEVAGLQEGAKVLVNGASGGVGSYALLLAKAKGCEVTAVCAGPKVDVVKSLGADHVIDYKVENFWENGVQYDVIFDAAGFNPLSKMADSLVPKTGKFVFAGGSFGNLLKLGLFGWYYRKGRAFSSFMSAPKKETLQALAALLGQGKLDNHIHKVHDLSGVPDAIRALEERTVVSKICVRIDDNNSL